MEHVGFTIVCFLIPLGHPFFCKNTWDFCAVLFYVCTVFGRRRSRGPWPHNNDKQWGGHCGCQNLFAGLVCHPILPSPNHAHASPPHLTYSIIVCISCNPSRLFSSRPWNYNLMIYFCSYNGKGKKSIMNFVLRVDQVKWSFDNVLSVWPCGSISAGSCVFACLS